MHFLIKFHFVATCKAYDAEWQFNYATSEIKTLACKINHVRISESLFHL